jgi:TRAP-type C4-dicarboxylate transport system permease small subunit
MRRLSLGGGWLLTGVAFLTVADASLRYGLSRPIPGTFELTELLLGAVIFFALPYTGLVDGHVSVDILTARLPPRAQHGCVAVAALVVAALLATIAWQLAVLTEEFHRTSRTTITARIPVFPFALPVTAAAGLAALTSLVQAVGAAARALRPELGPLPTPGA